MLLMKKKFLAGAVAALMLLASVPLISGCSAKVGYSLNTDEAGNKYYTAKVNGFSSSFKGELEIPEYYGEGAERYPVTEIAQEGFANTQITKLTIPKSVTKIGVAAFAYCPYLSEVNFAEGTEITEIVQGMFGFCTALKSVNLPDTVKEVGYMSFYKCERLAEVNLPDGLERISARAFSSCAELKNITLPETLVSIGYEAFYSTGLEKIIIPASVRDTETVNAVLDEKGEQKKDENGNPMTETVIIPGIGYAAFHTCTRLQLAVINADISTIKSGTFGYCPALNAIYLPKSLKKVEGALMNSKQKVYYGHPFHGGGTLTVYFAGSEDEWAAVEIDKTGFSENGVRYDNNTLISANKFYGRTYEG